MPPHPIIGAAPLEEEQQPPPAAQPLAPPSARRALWVALARSNPKTAGSLPLVRLFSVLFCFGGVDIQKTRKLWLCTSENNKRLFINHCAAFAAEMEGELTVVPGDRVQVHSDVDGWARVVRLSDGRTGLIPSWAVGAAS